LLSFSSQSTKNTNIIVYHNWMKERSWDLLNFLHDFMKVWTKGVKIEIR
jgi:hypothetical protein